MKPWSTPWLLRSCLALASLGNVMASPASADVIRYRDEASYLAALAALDAQVVSEGFEGSAWDDARSPDINDRHAVSSKWSQGVLWEPAAKDIWGDQYSTRAHGLTTNHNWARSGQWGLYEDHNGEPYPTTIRISSGVTLYGVGGWFNTNPDGQSVGFLFEGRDTAQDPGYVLPGLGAMYPGDTPAYGHVFVGLVDTDGFQSLVLTGTLAYNEDNQLEGGVIFGADDFLIGVARSVPEPNAVSWLLLAAFGAAIRRRPKQTMRRQSASNH